MTFHRLADGLSQADIQGMSLDPQAQDPEGYQNPRDVVSEPATDEQDPATPGGPSPYNGAEPFGQPVTSDPMWKPPDEPKKPPYSPLPYVGPGPSLDTTTLHNARLAGPMEETMTDLWVTASQDTEAELESERMVRAKVATSAIWPFLSAAVTEREFGHRLALCASQMEDLFPEADFRERVAVSLGHDYRMLKNAGSDDLWDDFHKADTDSKLDNLAQGGGWHDWGHMHQERQNDDALNLRRRYEGGSGEHGFSEHNDEPHYQVHHPSGWIARHVADGPEVQILHKGTGEDVHDSIEVGSHHTGRPAESFGEQDLHQNLHHWVSHYGEDYASSIPGVSRWQKLHRAGAFKTAAEPEQSPAPEAPTGSRTNPLYPDPTPENGPNTGSDGQFAQFPAGPDPWNPMNAQYPMQPGQWTVPPDKDWVERPLTFPTGPGQHSAAVVGHPDHATHYRGEGVETGPAGTRNDQYFAGGGEGVAGDQQTGFPEDVSLVGPDERVDMNGTDPPQSPMPAAPVPYSNTPKQAHWVLAEKDNHGACAHCNSPVYRHGDDWKHLGGDPGHGVRLHDDHPWVANAQASRVLAVKHTAPGGGEHAPYTLEHRSDGWYVVNDKGETKNDKPHPTEDAARQHQKALYANVPGARESAEKEGSRKMAHWVLAEASSSDTGGSQQSSVDPMGAPPTPPSMEPGGAGSAAMQPLTIPNDQQSQNPFASGSGPEQTGSAAGMNNPFMASRREADVRERPDLFNPSGVADEFEDNTWENPAKQRPMQQAVERGINTPQQPGQPIQTQTSEVAQEEEAEEERR